MNEKVDEKGGDGEHRLIRIPFLRAPVVHRNDLSDEVWLEKGHEASIWLSLFYGELSLWTRGQVRHLQDCGMPEYTDHYVNDDFGLVQRTHVLLRCGQLRTDLAVVAVLTVFSTTHELSTPASIPTFFS